jgi:hypothetical protein
MLPAALARFNSGGVWVGMTRNSEQHLLIALQLAYGVRYRWPFMDPLTSMQSITVPP